MDINVRDLGAKQTLYWSMFSFQELDPYQESRETRELVNNDSWIRRGNEFLLTAVSFSYPRRIQQPQLGDTWSMILRAIL